MSQGRRDFLRSTGAGVLGLAGSLRLAPDAFSQISPLVRYPYLQNVGLTAGSVVWTTREAGVGTVEYSTDRSFAQSMTAKTRTFLSSETGVANYYQHEVRLSDLRIGTQYNYRVLLNGKTVLTSDDLRLRTAGTGDFTFLVFGDSGQNTPAQLRVATAMEIEKPDLLLHTGDIAYMSGTFDEFQRLFFNYYRDMLDHVPFFPCPGNHDYETKSCGPYLTMYSVPTADVPPEDVGRYYSFDWGNIHFVSLDSNTPLANVDAGTCKMIDWLERDLQNTRKFWKVAYWQHPPFSTGPNQKTPESALARKHICPVLDKYGVQIAFHGDEHNYQRSLPIYGGAAVDPYMGTVYITTGGGGADLYNTEPNPLGAMSESAHHYMRVSVQGGTLTARAIRPDGTQIDSVTLSPPPVINSLQVARAAATSPGPIHRGTLTILGRQLSPYEVTDSSYFPTNQVNGTVVHLDGRRLPLAYVSGDTIIALLRSTGRGPATVRVTTPNGWTETETYF
jgi:3',5'-cyclic AMP phosphodiesterase CpdA